MSRRISRFRSLAEAFISSRHLLPITSALFLIIICTALLLVYRDYKLMCDQIGADFNQQQLILARQISSQIDTILRDIETEMKSLQPVLAGQPELRRRSAISAAFERIRTKGVIALGVMDPGGYILSEQADSSRLELTPELLADQCLCEVPGRMQLGPLRVEQDAGGKPSVRGLHCVQVVGIGDLAGSLLFAKLDVSWLVRSVARQARSGQTGYAWVIDESGMFLYHPRDDFIGQNAFTIRHERDPNLTFSQINRIMRERMMSGQEGTGQYVSAWHRETYDEPVTKLIAYTPVTSNSLPAHRRWSVAVVAPTSEVQGPVHRVYVGHFAAVAALIGGLFVFGLLAMTYQQRISRALKAQMSAQERYLATVLQNSVDAIIFIDNENCVQAWNKGAEAVFGYPAEEMLGQHFYRLVPPDINATEELDQIANEVFTKGFIRNYVTQRITKDGRRITVDISRTLVRNDEGEMIGSTAIIKDVTEKMELESRIYNTEKLASIGTLAAGVAHEINNPLTVILGFTDLLLERFQKDSCEYDDLKTIEQNANHARQIVQDLLGFARITEGLEDTVDVEQCLKTVVSIVKNTLMTKRVQLETQVEDRLPRVCGDTREFQQVIFNLVNNAMSAMEAGGGGTLTIGARAEDGWIHVTVADTGPGIPDRIKPQVFDPFFTTKKVGEGTGLGLSLCYGIVKKYGGKIQFTSVAKEDHPDEPSGTVFTVFMPQLRDAESRTGEDS